MIKKFNILIVDDNKHFIGAMKFLLETCCMDMIDTLSVAIDGEECLEVLHEKQIDVIFMDIEMPGLDGIETTKIISSDFRDIKIVAVTFHTDEEYIIKVIEAGAKNFITKSKMTKEKIREVLISFSNI